jgi:hypothetical protein
LTIALSIEDCRLIANPILNRQSNPQSSIPNAIVSLQSSVCN